MLPCLYGQQLCRAVWITYEYHIKGLMVKHMIIRLYTVQPFIQMAIIRTSYLIIQL